ncbi:hypothetical protein BCR33DRAFT_857744 [Rhizoclosmatium globosum]|uniref:Uncharacterized protein n=1 Tax=Rhizoclosmatium globosum TaxID=329046 RepID=A0A1Y2B320_9FUNG|nr:hypothetical protein BCR33DRAFT_857744 [Rhizoclosmatium globosum]|eukprot:ORY29213.1 hypothetical protein BCR33DRAFT_857744 [Rhizoclosmatium globosum]
MFSTSYRALMGQTASDQLKPASDKSTLSSVVSYIVKTVFPYDSEAKEANLDDREDLDVHNNTDARLSIILAFSDSCYVHNYPLKIHVEGTDETGEIFPFTMRVTEETTCADLKKNIRNILGLHEECFKLAVYKAKNMTTIGDNKPLKLYLTDIANPQETTAFKFQVYIEVIVHNEGSAGKVPLVIRANCVDIAHFKTKIQEGFHDIKSYDIFAKHPRGVMQQITEGHNEVLRDAFVSSLEFVLKVSNPSVSPYTMAAALPNSVSNPVLSIDPNEAMFDVMISYNQKSSNDQVNDICEALENKIPGIKIWRDKDQMKTDINEGMCEGVIDSKAVIVCLSKGYLTSQSCKKEIRWADELKKPLIPAYMFAKDEDPVVLKQNKNFAIFFFYISSALYADFKESRKNSPVFETALDVVVGQIKEKVLASKRMDPVNVINVDAVKQWLDPVDFSNDLLAYKSEYVAGTRFWALEAICSWIVQDADSKFLWLYGGAGTGKSLISYAVTKYLPGDHVIIGSSFFCRYNNDRKNRPSVIVANIVWDLCCQFSQFEEYIHSKMASDIEDVTKYKRTSILLDPVSMFNELVVKGLKKILPAPTKTILLVIDALDECKFELRSSLLDILQVWSRALPPYVKLFVTSRPEQDIFDRLQEINSTELTTTSNDNQYDIELVVDHLFQKHWMLDNFPMETVSNCKKLLVQKSEGLFIYVRTMIEYLTENDLTPASAADSIKSFSSGLSGIYESVARKALDHPAFDLGKYQLVFGAILCGNEPFDTNTLSVLMGISVRQTIEFIGMYRSILKFTGGRISTIHKSVRDYFTSNYIVDEQFYISPQQSNIILAERCLVVLDSLFLVNPLLKAKYLVFTGEILDANLHPAVVYAMSNWVVHLHSSISNWTVNFDMKLFPPSFSSFAKQHGVAVMAYALETQNEALFSATENCGGSVHQLLSSSLLPSPALFMAAKFGLATICKSLLQSSDEPLALLSLKNQSGLTPLHVAAISESLETVKVLKEFGAKVEENDNSGKKPLDYAVDADIKSILSKNQESSTIYNHHYPLQVKVTNGIKFDDYEMVIVNHDFLGRDMKVKIREAFQLELSYKLFIFYKLNGQQIMLTDQGRVEKILQYFKDPAAHAAISFSNFVDVEVRHWRDCDEIFTVMVFEFTMEHLRAQIDGLFGEKYQIWASKSEGGDRILVNEDSLTEILVNGYILFIQPYLDDCPVEDILQLQNYPKTIRAESPIKKEKTFDVMAILSEFPDINIWRDKDQTTTDIYQGMAQGIINSSVMIIFSDLKIAKGNFILQIP